MRQYPSHNEKPMSFLELVVLVLAMGVIFAIAGLGRVARWKPMMAICTACVIIAYLAACWYTLVVLPR